MTLNRLKTQYARLCSEIASMAGAGRASEDPLTRLHRELDRIDRDLETIRARAQTAPVLGDTVITVSQPGMDLSSPG